MKASYCEESEEFPMISAIVYTSNSGYTAEYARLLGRATGLPVNDLRQVHTPSPTRRSSSWAG